MASMFEGAYEDGARNIDERLAQLGENKRELDIAQGQSKTALASLQEQRGLGEASQIERKAGSLFGEAGVSIPIGAFLKGQGGKMVASVAKKALQPIVRGAVSKYNLKQAGRAPTGPETDDVPVEGGGLPPPAVEGAIEGSAPIERPPSLNARVAELDTPTEGGDMADLATNVKGIFKNAGVDVEGAEDEAVNSISKLSGVDIPEGMGLDDLATGGAETLAEMGGATAGSVLGTALGFLGPVGMLAGIGMGIASLFKEGETQSKEAEVDKNYAKATLSLQKFQAIGGGTPEFTTGSMAMPVLDSSSFRAGSGNF